jgi:hypothetical protein
MMRLQLAEPGSRPAFAESLAAEICPAEDGGLEVGRKADEPNALFPLPAIPRCALRFVHDERPEALENIGKQIADFRRHEITSSSFDQSTSATPTADRFPRVFVERAASC